MLFSSVAAGVVLFWKGHKRPVYGSRFAFQDDFEAG